MEQTIPVEYLRMLRDNYEQFIGEMEQAGVRVLRIPWENFQPISEVVRLVHEYSLKPSSFTKWVRPMRRIPSSKSDARNDAKAEQAAAAASGKTADAAA